MTLSYHNHQDRASPARGQDDPRLDPTIWYPPGLKAEIDTYWVQFAAEIPAGFLVEKAQGQDPALALKDYR